MIINGEKWKISYKCLKDYGETDYNGLSIRINHSLDPIEERRTLLHEIIHAYIYAYGIPFTEHLTEEQLCDFIAYNLDNFYKLASDAEKELKKEKEENKGGKR